MSIKEIWITRDMLLNKDYAFRVFTDKPILEPDGIWRSHLGPWGAIEERWWPDDLKPGEVKHYKIVED